MKMPVRLEFINTLGPIDACRCRVAVPSPYSDCQVNRGSSKNIKGIL